MFKLLMAVLLFSTVAVLFFAPLATLLVSRLGFSPGTRGPFVVALTLIIFIAILSISASWSYGLFGASNFPIIVGVLSGLSLGTLLFRKVRSSLGLLREFERSDALTLMLLPIVLILSRTYWQGWSKWQLASGPGPDSAQNFMVVSAQQINQTTWTSSRDYFFKLMDTDTLWDGLYRLYQMPSFVDQAAIDYLVYGTRWGLSIPFSQLMRLDRSLIAGEQALVLGISLTAIGFLIYGAVKQMTGKSLLSTFFAVISISSTPLLIQFFNGGVAQIWATPGLVLLSVIFIIVVFHSKEIRESRSIRAALIFIAVIGWLATAVTYLDSAMTLAAQVVITSLALFIFRKKSNSWKIILTTFSISGLVAALVVAPYSFAALQTLTIRLRLAQGTGIDFKNWPLPSEMLGLFDVWTGSEATGRDPIILMVAILVSAYIVWLVLRKLPGEISKDTRVLGLSIFFSMIAILFWTLNTGVGRNYAYVKFSTYLTPLLILVLALRWSDLVSVARKKQKISSKWYGLTIPSIFTLAVLGSALPASGSMYQNAEYVVPQEQFSIYKDRDAQYELANFNYLTTYRPINNFLGALGNVHWVSKAPNDLDLSTRMVNEMRIICFASDVACKPNSLEIASALNKYGLRVFQSPITTAQFVDLPIIDRYNAATDAVGQERLQIPERFIGGNPLLKTDQ